MRARLMPFVIWLLWVLSSTPASAQIIFNGIVPQIPEAGETIKISMSDGDCDAIVEAQGYPQVTRVGNHIRVLFETAHAEDPLFCNFPGGTGSFPIGHLEMGIYTLQVDRHYSFFDEVTETLGETSFQVVQPASVPTLSVFSLTGLALLLVGSAFLQACTKRHL